MARESSKSPITGGMQGKSGHSFTGILHKGIQQKLDKLVFVFPANAEISRVCASLGLDGTKFASSSLGWSNLPKDQACI